MALNAPPQPSVSAPAYAVCFPSGQRQWRVPDASPLPAPAPALPARPPTRTCSRALRSGSDLVSPLARSLSLHSESSAVPATLGGPRGTSDLMASSQVSEPSRGPRCAAPPHSTGPLDPYSRPRLACMTLLCAPAASACPLGPRSSRASGALGCSSLELCTVLLTLQGLSRKNTCRHPRAPPLACADETPHLLPSLFEGHPPLFTYLSP